MKGLWHILLLLLLALPAQGQRHQVRREGKVLAHDLRFDPDRITDEMPVGLQELLHAYQTRPRYANRQTGKAVAPLLKSKRSQESPFNGSCPYYIDDKGNVSDERCVAGCVATALEQIISFYRYPEVLKDTLHGWESSHYRIDDVLPGTRIDWDNILDDYRDGYTEEQAKAVSDLTYYCGMAVNMNWGLSSSSSSLGRGFAPLVRVFGYETVVFLPRAIYSSPTWNRMLRNELEQGRPICYTGHNMALSGHAFNIDGVDEEGYYHINWGYGGRYDGYYDLDYLNPYEQPDDMTDIGQQEGHFSNQTAMFLYPEDIDIDIQDSLRAEDAFAGVTVDEVTFRREPDTQGYTIADFSMTNTTDANLNFTFEVLTYLPTDTAVFQQADYVGLSTVNLAPGEHKTWPVYCQFAEAGERIFAFSADDETLPFQMPLHIGRGTPPVLSYGDVDYQLIHDDGGLTAVLSLDISNEAANGYAGNLITFCLFPEDGSPDLRHWEVLALAGGETHRAKVRFRNLQDGATYTLRVRCPWVVRQEYTFTVRSEEATGIEAIEDSASSPAHLFGRETSSPYYDLNGRRLTGKPGRGIVVRSGRKYLMR